MRVCMQVWGCCTGCASLELLLKGLFHSQEGGYPALCVVLRGKRILLEVLCGRQECAGGCGVQSPGVVQGCLLGASVGTVGGSCIWLRTVTLLLSSFWLLPCYARVSSPRRCAMIHSMNTHSRRLCCRGLHTHLLMSVVWCLPVPQTAAEKNCL